MDGDRQSWRDDDACLLDLLADLIPLPPQRCDAAAAGRSVYTWRTVDAELAQLLDLQPCNRPSTVCRRAD